MLRFMMVTFLALAGLTQTSISQWQIPKLTEEQGLTVLQEIWPTYAMQSEQISGPYFDLTSDTIRVLTERGTVKYTLVSSDSFQISLNDTASEVFALRIGEIVTRTALYTGDTSRTLCFMAHSLNAQLWASVAWIPKEFLWTPSYQIAKDLVDLKFQTDSLIWKMNETYLGTYARNYFSASLTDDSVKALRDQGAVIYYMGAKSATTQKTPVRGYKP